MVNKRLTESQKSEIKRIILNAVGLDNRIVMFAELFEQFEQERTVEYLGSKTTAEKRKLVDDWLMEEKLSDAKRRKVDRDAEKLKDRPGSLRRMSTKEKGAAVDQIRKELRRDSRISIADVDIFDYIRARVQRYPRQPDYNWYRARLREYGNLQNTDRFIKIETRVAGYPVSGNFYNFNYWAKTYPEDMPVFDRNPLIYCLENRGSSFLGINFHWINSYRERFELVERLLSGDYIDKFPNESYHTYLMEDQYLRSPVYQLNDDEMKTAVLLPLERWQIS